MPQEIVLIVRLQDRGKQFQTPSHFMHTTKGLTAVET